MDHYSVRGITGYPSHVQPFIEATLAVDFAVLHHDFLPFLPLKPSRVLDVGAGIGRDAAVLADRGHSVVAVEPTEAFRIAGRTLYDSEAIEWLDDSLPRLSLLADQTASFDFVLASGVWHHLDHQEQAVAMVRIAELLKPNGIFALSLRQGPPGVGSEVFPTNSQQTIQDAQNCGLTTLLHLDDQPSLLPNKTNVRWSRLAFQKQESS